MFALPSTFNHAQALPSMGLQAAVEAAHWQIDCAALTSFDSSALAFLLDMQRAAIKNNAVVTIHNAPVRLTQLAALYGVHDLIAATAITKD
jgi:phospholipid transport system transporter-binding protein